MFIKGTCRGTNTLKEGTELDHCVDKNKYCYICVILQLKTDHTESSQALPFATPPIPRITVKLETASQPALLTNKGMIKTETSQMYVLGYAFMCWKYENMIYLCRFTCTYCKLI